LGINPVLSDVEVTVSVWPDSFAGPALTPEKLTVWSPEFWGIGAGSAMTFRVGGSFTAVTLMLNVWMADVSTPPLSTPPLSWIETETIAVPLALAAGV
jgi:hypothetical protein